ncbi:PilZ domain-containing protein [Sphingomonas paeninsulae]|uniref:PilZ domain-containing protein n=2 Tax=Sphingomonas paeninsulae TaxID=2319844 RepID=A0A494TM51_SPHPE|nr:PilZ domain-containing protein [Sphingomonas paeninsulae]
MAAQEDRSAPRHPLTIAATLRPSGATGFKTVVTDLSLSGFAAQALTNLHAGTLCWLTLPGLSSLQAEVVWNDGNTIGCAFATLLNPAVLQSVVDRCS